MAGALLLGGWLDLTAYAAIAGAATLLLAALVGLALGNRRCPLGFPHGGATWRNPEVLNRSKEIFDAGDGRAAFAEKAIVTTSSRVLLYFLISDVSQDARWEPFLPPLSCYSDDGGHTWSEPADMQLGRGRIYDAKKIHNVPYVLFFRNDASVDFFGVSEEHKYVLYTTDDWPLLWHDL
jgi:hypothetical protein